MKQLYEIVLCKVLHGSDAGTTRDIVEAGSEAEAIEKARASWKELGVTTRPFFSATEDAANDLEASADLEVAAKAVDAKANGDTKPKKRGPKARKITDEMVVRALELRAKKGLGFHKVAQAISEEFGVEKLSPHNLRIRMMKAKGVDSLNDLAKKSTIAKEVPVPASTKK